jgi:hypothetical protein
VECEEWLVTFRVLNAPHLLNFLKYINPLVLYGLESDGRNMEGVAPTVEVMSIRTQFHSCSSVVHGACHVIRI